MKRDFGKEMVISEEKHKPKRFCHIDWRQNFGEVKSKMT